MAYNNNRNQISDNRGIERLLESKFIEADKNLLFSLAFENEFPNIAKVCNKIAENNIEDIKNIGRVLLSNAYNPKLHINFEMTSIELKHDFSCKGPYSAVSVINYNTNRLKKISEYTKNLILDDEIMRFEGLTEVMNKVLLRDIENIELLEDMLKNKMV